MSNTTLNKNIYGNMKESNILKLIEIEAGKRGYIAIRLNSGMAYGVNGNIIRLCPEGTADCVIIANNGHTIWVETKTKTGKQREAQKRFQKAIEQLGHKYIVARNVKDVFND